MQYITQPGDTLDSIAARFTLSPAYGSAIARNNGLTNEYMETPTGVALEDGLALDIPDSWLKPAARAEVYRSNEDSARATSPYVYNNPTLEKWLLAGAGLALLLTLFAAR